jgi:hypothetical protein
MSQEEAETFVDIDQMIWENYASMQDPFATLVKLNVYNLCISPSICIRGFEAVL